MYGAATTRNNTSRAEPASLGLVHGAESSSRYSHLVTGEVRDRIHKSLPLVHILRQRNPIYPISLRGILILSSNLRLFLPVCFLQVSLPKLCTQLYYYTLFVNTQICVECSVMNVEFIIALVENFCRRLLQFPSLATVSTGNPFHWASLTRYSLWGIRWYRDSAQCARCEREQFRKDSLIE
jgi:hypothetical protein